MMVNHRPVERFKLQVTGLICVCAYHIFIIQIPLSNGHMHSHILVEASPPQISVMEVTFHSFICWQHSSN